MATELQLANRALAKFGEPPLAAINTSTPHGQHVVELGPHTAEFLLSLRPWTWARHTVSPVRSLSTPATGALYQYPLPADLMVGPARVFDPSTGYPIEGWRQHGNDIHTDAPEISISYTRTSMASPAVWPQPEQLLYVDALEAALAIPITGDKALAAQLQRSVYGNSEVYPLGGLVGKAISRDRQRDPWLQGVKFAMGFLVEARRTATW